MLELAQEWERHRQPLVDALLEKEEVLNKVGYWTCCCCVSCIWCAVRLVCIAVQLLGIFSELIVGTDSVLHWLYLLTSVEHTALRSSPLENL
jgi:hypothetical protein